MIHDTENLSVARDRAVASRVALRDAVHDAMERFAPQRLKEDAAVVATHQLDEAKAALRRTVKRHPVLLWSTVAIVLAFILRRPVGALVRQIAAAARAIRTRFADKDARL